MPEGGKVAAGEAEDVPPDPEEEARSAAVGPSRPRLLGVLGPGLITGASDDDPVAIGTYAQTGAAFGYALCWLPLLCWPLMAVVQEISGRIGRTTGRGLAGAIGRSYPRPLLWACVVLILFANTVALAADLGAMGDALRLLVGGPRLLYVVLFAALCVGLQVGLRYTRYVAVLKWTTVSLLAYFAAAALAGVEWGAVARGLVPSLRADEDWVTAVVAVFGVALSPFLLFWQSAQEVEDQRVMPRREPLLRAPEQAPTALRRIRLDTVVGMGVAVLVGLAIMVTAAATLHAEGITAIGSSAQAAEALRPAAGPFAFALFALGIIGTGLLAVPVLAGSAAYAIGEARRWPVGLSRGPLEAKAFYGTLAAATAVGAALNLTGVDPIRALYWSAVVNGVAAAPLLALTVLVASRRDTMGAFAIGPTLRAAGWATVALLAASAGAMAFLAIRGGSP